MPITAIFPTITFPHRGVQAKDAFVLAQETAQDLLSGDLTTNLTTFKTEANALELNVNTKEASAVAAAASSIAASNFQGTWTSQLTVIGQSWEYNGVIYGVLVAGTSSPITTPSNWIPLNLDTVVGTIATLRTTQYSGQQIVSVTGYYTALDNIGVREYSWDAISVEADNGGTIIQVTGIVTGRWKMKYSGAVNVKWFGAKGDGVTDDVSYFQSAINSFPSIGVYNLYVPDGFYAGDFSILLYGTRKIMFDLSGGASFVSTFPYATRSTIKSGDELSFSQNIVPAKHLKQFSTRPTTSGIGAIAGAITYSAGAITNIAITLGGTGYVSPRVIITGDGTGAIATATIAGGIVTGFVITAGGTGYTTASVYIVDGPIIVIVGDSISTINPTTSLPVYDGQYEEICKGFRNKNPKKQIKFFNRAIGSQTWTSLNSIPSSNYPEWYSNISKAWLSYIQELQPDVVVLAFGMNDRQNFVPAQMIAAINSMATWAYAPDIILCTNMVSSAITADPNLSSSDSQIGRDFVAGYERSYAIKNDIGLIDIHRQFRLIRDGEDHTNSALKYYTPNSSVSLPYTFPNAGDGLYLKSIFDCSVAGFWTNKAIELQSSYAGINMVEWIRISDNGGNLNISIQEYNASGIPYTQASYTTATHTPILVGTIFEVTISGQTLTIYLNGLEVLTTLFIKGGGIYSPILRRVDISTPTLPTSISDSTPIISAYGVGQYAQYQPRLDDYQIFGYGTIAQFGGNAQNHPSSLAIKMIINPPIENSNLSYSPITFGTSTSNVTTFTGVNEPNPVAIQHITKTPYPSTLTPPANASNQLLEDVSSVGQSLMTGSTGVTRWNTGNELNNQAFTMAYVHSLGTFTWAQNGTTLLGLLSSGVLYPNTDNTQSLGTASKRWSVVYAGTGTINTSDERDKTFYTIEESERLCAIELKGMMRKFKFNDAIIKKGESNARIHFGVGAQSVKGIFEKHGLNPFDYALLCYDSWEEQKEVKDENGNIIQEHIQLGDKYGIRYEELLCFILSAI